MVGGGRVRDLRPLPSPRTPLPTRRRAVRKAGDGLAEVAGFGLSLAAGEKEKNCRGCHLRLVKPREFDYIELHKAFGRLTQG